MKSLLSFLFINIYLSIIKRFLLKPDIFTMRTYSSDDRILIDKEWVIDISWLWFNLTVTKEYV